MSQSSDIDRRVAVIAARQHAVVARDQLLAVGVTPSAIKRRCASGRWIAIERGVYLIHGAPVTWHTRLMAACLATGGVASHRSAAVLHEVRGFRPGRAEVTVERGRRARATSARVHESGDIDLIRPWRIDGIPTTDAARLSVDLGSVCPFEQYELGIDDLLGRKALTWDLMLDALMAHAERGRNGVGALRALLVERYGEEVSDSALERAFMRLWRRSTLPEPTSQHEIFDEVGFIARVDYAYPERRIAIELDSKKFHLTGVAFEEDPRKRNRLKLAGWLVLEFTWRMIIEQPMTVLRQIERALAATR